MEYIAAEYNQTAAESILFKHESNHEHKNTKFLEKKEKKSVLIFFFKCPTTVE